MQLIKFMNSKEGSIVISVLFGLALAGLFRQTCKNRGCIVIKGPKTTEVNQNIFKVDGKCYKYTPYVVDCGKEVVETPHST
jgi:hypothetical protein